MSLTYEWVDSGREPRCAPDPKYPQGKDLDISMGAPSCYTCLPYPARRCGYFVVECSKCGWSIAVTTAGRANDPCSIRVACKGKLQ